VQDGQNNKLVYKFPNSVRFDNDYISLSQVQLYYSWFNITSLYQNNKIQYIWVSGGTSTTFTITIPDGLYEVSTLNQLLQYSFIANGHYLVSSGQNIYYAEIVVNPARYAIQINTFLFPTSLPVGYTNPASLVFPTNTFNPSIILPASINKIFGFVAGFTTNINTSNGFTPPTSDYVSKNAVGTLSYISTTSPNVQPNSSVIIALSNIDNTFAQPSGTCYTIVPNVAIGEIINEKPVNYIWNKLIAGTYNQISVQLLGTDLQPIIINDPSMTFVFILKNGAEMV